MTRLLSIRSAAILLSLMLLAQCGSTRAALTSDQKALPLSVWSNSLEINKNGYPKDFKPENPQTLVFKEKSFQLVLFSRGFAQGDLVYFELTVAPLAGSDDEDYPAVFFEGRQAVTARKDWGYVGYWGIHPQHKPLQSTVAVWMPGTEKKIYRYGLKIKPVKYPEFKTSLKLGKYSDVEYLKKLKEQQTKKTQNTKKQQVNKSKIEEKSDEKNELIIKPPVKDYRSEKTCHPRDLHKITSPFWATRRYERYVMVGKKKKLLEPRTSIHRGLDLRGFKGHKVFAMQSGVVILAKKDKYGGNTVVIDHGVGLRSVYMHLNKYSVKAGDKVKAGEQIAESGDTGMVTAAHLHWSVYSNGVPVDPLSVLVLPVRK